MLKTASNRLYTGITRELSRRLAEHEAAAQWREAEADGRKALAKKGAKALRGHGPLALVFSTEITGHGQALRLEHRIKQLTRRDKESLIAGKLPLSELISETAGLPS